MAFCTIVGFDPDMSALMAGPHQVALKAQLSALFLTRTFEEWKAIAGESDCCLEPVLSPEEALQDAMHHTRGSMAVVDGLTLVGVSPGGDEASFAKRAPGHGEQGREVLIEAGLTSDEIDLLLSDRVLRIG